MLNEFINLLEYSRPYKLKHSFKNYFIITTQDKEMVAKQKLVRTGKLQENSYKVFEKKRLIEVYGLNLRKFNAFYNRTYKNKF